MKKKQEIMKIKLKNQDFIFQYVFLNISIRNIYFLSQKEVNIYIACCLKYLLHIILSKPPFSQINSLC